MSVSSSQNTTLPPFRVILKHHLKKWIPVDSRAISSPLAAVTERMPGVEGAATLSDDICYKPCSMVGRVSEGLGPVAVLTQQSIAWPLFEHCPWQGAHPVTR